jgi:hypothetical protein
MNLKPSLSFPMHVIILLGVEFAEYLPYSRYYFCGFSDEDYEFDFDDANDV